MKITQDFNIKLNKPSVVTIGNFDGLHIGHKKLIESVKEISEKENLNSIIISFEPHPLQFFNKNNIFYTILSQEEKIYEFKNLKIDYFINYKFDEDLSNLEPEAFAKNIFEKLKCKTLIVGQDYHFGKNRAGNVEFLSKIAKNYNAEVVVINEVSLQNKEKVSSSKIKEYILKNELEKATLLLGKPYYIISEVVKGNQIGRTINFPTINFIPLKSKVLPSNGVYISRTEYKEKKYNSITNIGKRPTINGKERVIETFIFDFDKQIYGEKLKVMLYKNIRKEKKFSSIDELKEQISKDTITAKKFFVNNF